MYSLTNLCWWIVWNLRKCIRAFSLNNRVMHSLSVTNFMILSICYWFDKLCLISLNIIGYSTSPTSGNCGKQDIFHSDKIRSSTTQLHQVKGHLLSWKYTGLNDCVYSYLSVYHESQFGVLTVFSSR